MIDILVLQNPGTPDVNEIASARMDDEGNLLVTTGGIHIAIRRPMVQPLQEGESIWRFVERCAAAAAMTEEELDKL
ncbi:MAG: hypothetical protein QOG73_1703 [Acetobacteraceae bacterium]|jgi:hypothetical protein|nr:hypothetical protein [Acetobacteraceae bacterium]